MIEYLPWDSNFFGIKVGKLRLESHSKFQTEDIIQQAQKDGYNCIYLETETNIFPSSALKRISTRIELERSISSISISDSSILEVDLGKVSSLYPVLKDISKTSRFYKDIKFRPLAFKLYKEWADTYRSQQKNKKMFCFVHKNKYIGFIGILLKNNIVTIELFGIKKSHRGKGYGSRLLEFVLRWAKDQNYHIIQVATQDENIEAKSVYKKNGFIIKRKIDQFHLWI